MNCTLIQASPCPVTAADIGGLLGKDLTAIAPLVDVIIATEAGGGSGAPVCTSIWAYDDQSFRFVERGGVAPTWVGPYYERQMMADGYPPSRVRDVRYDPDPKALKALMVRVAQRVANLPDCP